MPPCPRHPRARSPPAGPGPPSLTPRGLGQSRARFSRTLRGRALNVAGYFLSLFCVYKMVIGLDSQAERRDPRRRPAPTAPPRLLAPPRLASLASPRPARPAPPLPAAQSTVNIAVDRAAALDPVSRALRIALQVVRGAEIDAEAWLQHAAFAFVGVVVASQMRGLLRNLMRFRAMSAGISSGAVILLLSQASGRPGGRAAPGT
eukprot:tig00000475_g1249.t1